ncbi:MAG: Uncharacterised protein [Cyanobium sp. ARS6]|nr:MAG: Uncharacterised protein [Cyanobium sp. ARS6]
MIQFQIGDHAQGCVEFHQGAVGFIGFCNKQTACARMTVACVTGNDATDHSGGIFSSTVEERSDHCARGGFAVAARYCDGGLLINQGSEQIGAVPDSQFQPSSCGQFRIAVRDGTADDDQGRSETKFLQLIEIVRRLRAESHHPQRLQGFHCWRHPAV